MESQSDNITKLEEGFFNLLADDYWKEIEEFSQRKWVTIEEFKAYNSPIYGDKEVEDGIVTLQHAAAEARNYILSNPTELPFQMITRLRDSASANKVVHTFIKCLMIYSDHPVVFSQERCWDKPGGPLKLRIRLGFRIESIQISTDSNDIISTFHSYIMIIQKQTGKILRILKGHSDIVHSISVSANGKWIVSGSSDMSVIVWDRESGKQHGPPLTGHIGSVKSVAISANGKWIVSGSDDGSVIVWNRESGKQHGPPLTRHIYSVKSVAISADGNWIVSGSDNGPVVVWDRESGKQHCPTITGHRNSVTSVAISSDGKWIVSGSRDESLLVWDRESGKQHGTPLKGHKDWVSSVAISADGKWIVSASADKSVIVWDRESGKQHTPPLTGHSRSVMSIAISADGKWFVSGSDDGTVVVWEPDSGKQHIPRLIGHKEMVRYAEISTYDKWIVSGAIDNTVLIWDRESGNQLITPLTGQNNRVRPVVISANGKWIVSGSEDKSVVLWDIESGKQHGPPLTEHTDMVRSMTISADGKWIVSRSNDKSVIVWDRESGKQNNLPLSRHCHSVNFVTMSLDGMWIGVGCEPNSLLLSDLGVNSYTFLVNNCTVGSVIECLQVFANLEHDMVGIVFNDSLIVGDISSSQYCSISTVGLGKITDISFQGSSEPESVVRLKLTFSDSSENVFTIRNSIRGFEAKTSNTSDITKPVTLGKYMPGTDKSENGQTEKIGLPINPLDKDGVSRSLESQKRVNSSKIYHGNEKENITFPKLTTSSSEVNYSLKNNNGELVEFHRSKLLAIEEVHSITEEEHQLEEMNAQNIPGVNGFYSKQNQIISAESHKVVASLPFEIYNRGNGISFCEKTGTIIAVTRDGPVYSLKVVSNVSSHRVDDFMNTHGQHQ